MATPPNLNGIECGSYEFYPIGYELVRFIGTGSSYRIAVSATLVLMSC